LIYKLLPSGIIVLIVEMATEPSFSLTPPWRDPRATSQYLSAYTRPEHSTSISPPDEAMTSTTSPSVEQMIQTITADGFFAVKDASKGSEAEEFAREGFPITTVKGIEFCKAHTFDDPVSRKSRPCSPFPPHLI